MHGDCSVSVTGAAAALDLLGSILEQQSGLLVASTLEEVPQLRICIRRQASVQLVELPKSGPKVGSGHRGRLVLKQAEYLEDAGLYRRHVPEIACPAPETKTP